MNNKGFHGMATNRLNPASSCVRGYDLSGQFISLSGDMNDHFCEGVAV